MAGQLIDKGDQKWGCKIYLGFIDGQRKYKYETFHGTKKQAEKHLRKMLTARDQGQYDPSLDRAESLTDYLTGWLKRVKPTVRRRTYGSYEYVVENRVVPEIGNLRLEQVTPNVLIDLYSKLSTGGGEDGGSLSPRTVRKVHEVLRNALEWAVDAGKLASNPARTRSVQKSLPKRTTRERVTLPPEKLPDFLRAAEGVPFGAYFVLLLGSGLRPEEALALRWSDFDGRTVRINRVLEDRTLTFAEPKTEKSRRAVALPSFAVDALEAQRATQAEQREKAGAAWSDGDLIFPDESGRPLRQHRTARPWRKLLDAAELPEMRVYDLRHSCATLLLASGEPVKVVQERLGHSTATLTLDTYAHVLEGAQQQAADTLEKIANGRAS